MFILAITPGEGFDEAPWRRVLTSGIDAVMIREKHLEAGPLLELTRRTQSLAPGLQIWVNGRLDVALAAGCGLHAPEAYPEAAEGLVPLSRPLHDPAAFPARSAANQLILSPIFESPGKGAGLGAERLRSWLEELPPFPGRLLALGGITPENCRDLRHPRLAGVAMIRSLWHAPDPAEVVTRLREAWR
jgi:thiazole tautomerase (transcriptional regulator TenI)